MINDLILPDLETALEEFDEEVRFMEEAKCIDNEILQVHNNKIALNPTHVAEDDELCKATKISNIVLKREKSPSPIPSPDRRTSITSIQSLPKSPLILMKKPVLPIVSKFRWQNGFRKSKSGQYIKVPLLKIEIEFSSEFEFLPTNLQFSLYPDCNNNNDPNDERSNENSPLVTKTVKMCRNKYLCEMAANECNEERLKMLNQTFEGDFMVCIKESSVSSKSASCIIPDFFLLVENQLQMNPSCDNMVNGGSQAPNENNWIDTNPILTLDHFKKSIAC